MKARNKTVVIGDLAAALRKFTYLLEGSAKNDGTVTKEQIQAAQLTVEGLERELAAFNVGVA